ncbi:hypothetical protein PHMEG_00023176 [Phytophthora megakarya]|uniref:Uncharacterized protein n=1 Tax=Phytophthora megakarya TaxID=4795 RepID=A0A225VJC0_9STRA|nr:hypothetical protein PHMEG_00023176 [Phytophthora megakarya]
MTSQSLARITGISAYQYTLVYWLKLHALILWDQTLQRNAFPHIDCDTIESITLAHVFWNCSSAQKCGNGHK